jgi:hypothetical protein
MRKPSDHLRLLSLAFESIKTAGFLILQHLTLAGLRGEHVAALDVAIEDHGHRNLPRTIALLDYSSKFLDKHHFVISPTELQTAPVPYDPTRVAQLQMAGAQFAGGLAKIIGRLRKLPRKVDAAKENLPGTKGTGSSWGSVEEEEEEEGEALTPTARQTTPSRRKRRLWPWQWAGER